VEGGHKGRGRGANGCIEGDGEVSLFSLGMSKRRELMKVGVEQATIDGSREGEERSDRVCPFDKASTTRRCSDGMKANGKVSTWLTTRLRND
jgi:hypothetical protein